MAQHDREKTKKRLSSEVDAWNSRHGVGTKVILRKDDGSKIETRTRSKAEILSGHSAVIWLENVSGCHLLGRVRAIQQ